MSAPRPLDGLELAAIYRALKGRRDDLAAHIQWLEDRRLAMADDDYERLEELTRLVNRVHEVANVGGFTL